MSGLPLPPFVPLCFQCGTDQNPCHCKVVGPTIGFLSTVVLAVVCWPASIFCGCCMTGTGKKYAQFAATQCPSFTDFVRMLAAPVDLSGKVNNAIPI
ncbi:hypothetical protein LOCC1_G005316 [Lachnellula occidentalis]|uniref:Uncharacterized protein n=1 Tax=Lachnellula occidentalis TaxID=215460 RepID=A0A8H8RRW8_9HELO|nr:hypothetical protein LOCC1_G005316 [Lachnellula occidentalis]